MSKITAQDIKDLGFGYAMFGKTDNGFDDYLNAVIAAQALLLAGRIGAEAYASVASPTQDYVKRAELCLTAADLVQRRINRILGSVTGNGTGIDVTHEGAQKKAYRDEAELWIEKITSGTTTDGSDFASGTLVTDHFGGTT